MVCWHAGIMRTRSHVAHADRCDCQLAPVPNLGMAPQPRSRIFPSHLSRPKGAQVRHRTVEAAPSAIYLPVALGGAFNAGEGGVKQ